MKGLAARLAVFVLIMIVVIAVVAYWFVTNFQNFSQQFFSFWEKVISWIKIPG